MAGNTFSLVVVSPQRELVQAEVEELTAPAFLGEIGVLPGHTPFLCLLGSGKLGYRIGDVKKYMSVHEGFAEVGPEKTVVLAERAELADEIDVDRAESAKSRADERLGARGPERDAIDIVRAEAALRRALLRLQVAGR